jgi:uncharacterized membrane protein YhaH (DUF805 family)
MTQLCSLNGAIWSMVLALFDLISAFVIFGLMIRTTHDASWNGKPQEHWAMVRRYVYLLVVFAFFARAIFGADPNLAAPWMQVATSFVIAGALIFFLASRAFGLVDQDNWRGLRDRATQARHKL